MLSTTKMTEQKLRVFFQSTLSGLLKRLEELPRFWGQPKPLRFAYDDYVLQLSIQFAKIPTSCYCELHLCSISSGYAFYAKPRPYRGYAPLFVNPETYEKSEDSCIILARELYNFVEIDFLQKDCEQTAFIDNAIRGFYGALELVKADIARVEQKNPTLAQALQYRRKA